MASKTRVFEILEVASPNDRLSRAYDISIMCLILLNVIAVMLETVNSIYNQHEKVFQIFEVFSVIVFTIEYALRIWSCTTNTKYRAPLSGRARFMLRPLMIIDLLAILPFYLPMIIPFDLRFLRVIRLVRMFRILKFGRYAESLQKFGIVIRRKFEELVIAAFAMLLLLIIASSVLYYFENNAQPDVFSSIPAAMWWGVATLTTVGYGDVYPVTIIGKLFGALVAILGIGIFALPAGILAAGFTEVIKKERKVCPHCGKEIELE